MKLVLDASVAVKWVLPEADTPQALALRDGFRHQVHELIAPDTLPVEIAHALTRAERRGIIPVQSAIVRLTDVLATSPILHSYLSLLARAVELSSLARIGVYDCLYLALAEQEQCDFVTADQRLLTLGRPDVLLLANLP
ncbi:MAG: type II toxin-antitoxin system VapC family toxin [Pirellulaceae bacterium]|nr:type II toxin-antitoxin system VapC family toxin [Pirellulaceae bacterium]